MEFMKKIGLMLLGASVATIIIFGVYFHLRIVKLEIITQQIIQVIQQSQQQAKPDISK